MNPRSHHRFFLFLAVVLTAASPGCRTLGKKEKGEDRPRRRVETVDTGNQTDYYIGTISLVNEEHEFVLVRAIAQPPFEPGDTLEVRRDLVPVAQLSPSGERKDRFLAADILEGDPRVGDVVAFYKQAPPTPEKTKKKPFSRFTKRREARKQSKQLRKAAEQRRELEKASSWSAQ